MSYDPNDFEIIEEAPNHKWRVETPTIVLELAGLDLYQQSVYVAICSFAFEGSSCIASRKRIASRARCSLDKVDECVKHLETYSHPELKGKTLIRVERNRLNEDGSPMPNRIVKVDIWAENGEYWRFKEKNRGSRQHRPGVAASSGQGSRQQRPKEEEIKEEEKNNNAPPAAQASKDAVVASLSRLGIDEKLQRSLAKWCKEQNYDIERVRKAVEHIEAYPTKPDNLYGILRSCIEGEWWNQPSKEDKTEVNRLKATKILGPYDGKTLNQLIVSVCRAYVEISAGQFSLVAQFAEPTFDKNFENILNRLGISEI